MDLRLARRLAAGALAATLAVGLAGAPAQAAKRGGKKHDDVTLMTRNLYLGADLTRIFTATTLQQVADEAGKTLNIVEANNFPLRARALAREIRKKKPDLVGLQEVSLFRFTIPPDGPPPQGTAATGVLFDYLTELLRNINRGKRKKEPGSYRVVTIEDEADVEAPVNNRPGGFTAGSLQGVDLDVRLTDRDVILARVGAGVKTGNVRGGHFNTQLVVPIPGGGGTVTVTRGWNSLDANVRGKRFHLVNTHLEAEDAMVRNGQAQEMVAAGGPATSPRLPVVIIGDVNSDDDTVQGANRLAYQTLQAAGFLSRTRRLPHSCCYQTELLTNPADFFDHQVDHILTNRGRIGLVRSLVTGGRMFGGYWPSDHGGQVARLRFGR